MQKPSRLSVETIQMLFIVLPGSDPGSVDDLWQVWFRLLCSYSQTVQNLRKTNTHTKKNKAKRNKDDAN